MSVHARRCAALVALLAAACATGEGPSGDPVERTVTEAELAALPALAVVEGSHVCTSIGDDRCPLRAAAANRLDTERFALWEPGSLIRIWRTGDTLGVPVGAVHDSVFPYRLAIGVTERRGRYLVIAADSGWHRLEIDREGRLTGSAEVPIDAPLTVVGYVGDQPVRQQMRGWSTAAGGRMIITLLRQATDTSGTDILETPVPWLLGGTAATPPLPPYITANPAWALRPGQGIVWTPGDAFLVEYRDLEGNWRWRLLGPPGPPVSEADLAQRDSVVRAATGLMPFADEDYLSMRDRSDSMHPAVSGLTIARNGEVLVARATVADRDSVDFIRVADSGEPVGRFALGRRDRVLLFEGDSMLVHRPTEGEPWEVRWLTLHERR
jgi:hypothetical protein